VEDGEPAGQGGNGGGSSRMAADGEGVDEAVAAAFGRR
jgi:hypothetical protein